MVKTPKKRKETKKESPEFFTKKEGSVIVAEINKFVETLEKKHGKKFKNSMGVVIVALVDEKEEKPTGSVVQVNGNCMSLQQAGIQCISAVAKHHGGSAMTVAAAMGLSSMLR